MFRSRYFSRSKKTIAKVFFLLLLFFFYVFQQQELQHAPTSASARVIEVHDGDTLTVAYDGKSKRVRLFGVDSPELNQAHGKAARAGVRQLVKSHTFSVLELETDQYERPIVRMFFEDGRELNAVVVQSGFAYWYRRYAPKRTDLSLLEQEARRARRGLWRNPPQEKPWDYRKNRR